jgi:substrate import-associated zinc metallohydrolase lipoprotein
MIKMVKMLGAAFFILHASLFISCSKDEEPSEPSIFQNVKTEQSEFDQWIQRNYAEPYNIRLIYRYQDYETDQTYNVVPPTLENAKALAIMMKHIWLEAYEEAVSPVFVRSYCPRIFQFIGSAEHRSDGAIVLGTAEGGLKITMFRLNALDIDNIFIDCESPFPNAVAVPIDMNFWFFHTMHHEFCHILQQTKNYPTDFQLVSAGKYHSADWINVEDSEAPLEGFVTGYGSGEEREDMAEIYATYVTHTPEAWEKVLKAGIAADGNTYGRDAIVKKLDIMKEYFRTSWGFEMDSLRNIVLRRSKEVENLDLRNLK